MLGEHGDLKCYISNNTENWQAVWEHRPLRAAHYAWYGRHFGVVTPVFTLSQFWQAPVLSISLYRESPHRGSRPYANSLARVHARTLAEPLISLFLYAES